MSWYQNWFGSEFYDMLYKNRDDEEATSFIHKVFNEFSSIKNPLILDLCCGNGRHSLAMSEYGNIIGVDLSVEQIEKAKERNIQNATFYVHDMRKVMFENHFDFVFNLFSSFAYFDKKEEDLQVLESVFADLKSEGVFVQDFLNTNYIVPRLKEAELIRESNNINFEITRKLIDKKIVKTINIKKLDEEIGYFEEKVTAYSPDELIAMHKKVGLTPIKLFGDYKLSTFDTSNSPRIIIFSKKLNNV